MDTAFVSFRPACDIVGRIRNISRGGISFEYVRLDNSLQGFDALRTMALFTTNRSVNLSGLPFEIVYDYSMTDRASLIDLETCRCGLKFGTLTSSEKKLLDDWILEERLKWKTRPKTAPLLP